MTTQTRDVMFRLILEPAGHVVVEATNGEAAMEFISPDALPDVITTDLAMPIMNGERLITRLKASTRAPPRFPSLWSTADPDGARALETSGVVEAVVIKPFDPFAARSLHSGCRRHNSKSRRLGTRACLASARPPTGRPPRGPACTRRRVSTFHPPVVRSES